MGAACEVNIQLFQRVFLLVKLKLWSAAVIPHLDVGIQKRGGSWAWEEKNDHKQSRQIRESCQELQISVVPVSSTMSTLFAN